MKLRCNSCKKVLTSDMYPVKIRKINGRIINPHSIYYKDTPVYDDEDDVIGFDWGGFKYGVCYFKKGNPRESWTYKQKGGVQSKKEYIREYGDDGGQHRHSVHPKTRDKVVVGKGSVLLGVIPEFKSGYGCCDYSMGEGLYCECGNLVGHMHLDCYEDGSVEFIEGKVERFYK